MKTPDWMSKRKQVLAQQKAILIDKIQELEYSFIGKPIDQPTKDKITFLKSEIHKIDVEFEELTSKRTNAQKRAGWN